MLEKMENQGLRNYNEKINQKRIKKAKTPSEESVLTKDDFMKALKKATHPR